MAARGWANSTMTAIGVAAGAGAAQFGLVYGLGIGAWQPVRQGAGDSLWLANLAWTLWIAATSTVFGTVYANRSSTRRRLTAMSKSTTSKSMASGSTASGSAAGRDAGRERGRVGDLVSRIATALAAAIGALVTVPLVVLPARAALRADTFRPEITAGAYAVVGVLAGLAAALLAVNVRVIAANIVASTAWVWLLAVVSVANAVRIHRTIGTAQLAAWQFNDKGWFRETLHVPGAFLMLGAALLVGVFSALPADRRGAGRFGIAVSGAFGPLLVAAAYLLSAPKPSVRVDLGSAYGFSPYAVIAGLAGSVFVAVLAPLRPRGAAPASAPGRDAAPASAPGRDASPQVRETAAGVRDTAAPGYGAPAPVYAGAASGRAAGPASGRAAAPTTREAAPPPKAAQSRDDSDLTQWTRTLAGDPAGPTTGYGRPEHPAATAGAGTVAAGTDGVPQTATGWATAAQPVSPTVSRWAWSDVPKPRDRRDLGGPARS